MPYTQEDYNRLLAELYSLSDEKYRAFNGRLIPGAGKIIGVRVPDLHRLARAVLRGDAKGFLRESKDSTFEEKMLQGFVIAGMKLDVGERFEYIESFVKKIDNWALCDLFCSALRFEDSQLPALYSFLRPYFSSPREYEVRFAVVALMNFFLKDEYIDEALDTLCTVSHSGYYTKMAVAWAISECFVKYRDKTLPVLSALTDPFIRKKAVCKIRESYRASADDKNYLKTLL